jgi:hypothetical protein
MERSRRREFEFFMLVAMVGVLAFVLLEALERVREEFEEAAVQAEATAIRVELLDRLAHREIVGGPLPESRNPLRWIAHQPEGYVGEFDSSPSARGVWYFDLRKEALVYRFRSSREARFRLVRGAEMAMVQGGLSGVGLRRIEDAGSSAP